MNYAVTVTTTGAAMTDELVAELSQLGAGVTVSDDRRRCEAAFTIDAVDAPSATALAIEGVRAVRGDIHVETVQVSATAL